MSHVYAGAWALGCFGGQLRGDKECSFSGVTKSGRIWRKVPESEARSVQATLTRTPTTAITSSNQLCRVW